MFAGKLLRHHMPSMTTFAKNPLLKVILAFATVYIVWGSTYFFIQVSLQSFPPFMLGAIRFIVAGVLMLGWAFLQGERIRSFRQTGPSALSGFLILFCELAIVFWVEQRVPSSFVSIMLSTTAVWFVLLDRPNWAKNFKSVPVLSGIFFGLVGIALLFGEQLLHRGTSNGHISPIEVLLLMLAAFCWATGSLYNKNIPSEKRLGGTMGVAIQMLTAGVCFAVLMVFNGELTDFSLAQASTKAFMAVAYLISFGSIIAYSCYMWLLKVRTTTEVSTHVYVNPVVAVLLGIIAGREPVTVWQIVGLTVILFSVLLINLDKYKQARI